MSLGDGFFLGNPMTDLHIVERVVKARHAGSWTVGADAL
jgi:hypothetical protein